MVAAKRAASTAVATSDPTADAAPSLIPKLRSSNVGSVKKGLGPRSASAMEPRAGAIPVSSSTPATPRASPSKAPSAQKSPSLSGNLSPREARPLPSLIPTLTAPARPAAVPVPPVLPLDREGSVRSLLRKASEESVKSALKSPIKSSPRPALQTEAPRKRMIARHQSAANADAVVSPAPPSARSAHATHHARARASSITPRTPTATPPAAAAQPPPTLGSLVRQLKRGFSGRVDVDALQVATPSKSPVATRVPKPSILITDSAAPPKSGRVRHSSVQPSSSRAAPTLVATPTPNPATAFPMKRGEPTPMAEAGAARRKRSLSPTSAARALRLEARR